MRYNVIALVESLVSPPFHRYWVADDERVYESVKEDFKCVEELLGGVVERYGGKRADFTAKVTLAMAGMALAGPTAYS